MRILYDHAGDGPLPWAVVLETPMISSCNDVPSEIKVDTIVGRFPTAKEAIVYIQLHSMITISKEDLIQLRDANCSLNCPSHFKEGEEDKPRHTEFCNTITGLIDSHG